ncbi:hypothetical protein [Nocardia cyriacigeorgica]|uniref:hypothetical protein n=1 Tax=Nocardia cyriacigeorgica TaxID=135487 RepID=UPI0018949979|nr:hypothetical protein [Nocardia cyriacigeorgica]MBF6416953.1 hypothetical protein [Nocardia cyriacigeorgica]
MNLQDYLQAEAARIIRHGFGDLTAPLAEGEHVAEKRVCPHTGCPWELPTRWQIGSTTTRQMGLLELDAIAQAHLEEHALASWARG